MFTSESVTEGHPDKIADAISDAVLDDLLAQDPQSRVAVETLITTGQVHVAGEVTTSGFSDIMQIVRDVVVGIGYDDSEKGFDGRTCGVNISISGQSREIAAGVDRALEVRDGAGDAYDAQGAGDQGLMFGYACDDTPALMPLPISLAHALAEQLAHARRHEGLDYLRPDGKTQVTVEYDGGRAVGLDTLVVSTQHARGVTQEQIAQDVARLVVEPVLASGIADGVDTSAVRLLVNPSGAFELGGPAADTGLTGRKIIVDTYGGMARHGGGAFSGKDPSKVDRSGAYAMRWVAKNIVAAGLATRCEVQVAYAIGVAHPVGVFVETFGTGVVPDATIQAAVLEVFDLRPAAIIDQLGLKTPIYSATASYGHFGRPVASVAGAQGASNVLFPWERTDKVDQIKAAVTR
ncbi:MAG: methionine adenosyltransferase [Actinomycetales bacterium]|nr:methionine adenosyltransferase [Actinomycetales bacterium]